MGELEQANYYYELYSFFNTLQILLILPALFFCLIVFPYYTKQQIHNKHIRIIGLGLLSILELAHILIRNVYSLAVVAIILLLFYLLYLFKKHHEPLFLKWYKLIFSLLVVISFTLTVFVSQRIMKNVSLAKTPETIVINQDASTSILSKDRICKKQNSSISCVVNKKDFLRNYSVTSIQLLISEENYMNLKDKSYSISTYLGLFESKTYGSVQVEQIDQTYLLTVQTNLNLSRDEKYLLNIMILSIYLNDENSKIISNINLIDEYRITFTKNK